ncbi:MAG: endonuclease, partial [Phaeodactylibacter sp.]|nr:endonuclease [Phaeodactylibacter sp.]
GHQAYLTPGADPSQTVFNSNINLEHTYPKSKGTGGTLAENDMHHLFPSRADVNNDRGSHPLLEVNDNQTERWYYLDQTVNSIPGAQIDRYSEAILNDRFEPREDHKGNAARAVFYVYTMYYTNVIAADPDFFEIQRETLCQWHYLDPVDSLEWVRNQRIAGYQDDKPNPFILDCTLAARTYCGDVSGECLGINALPIAPDQAVTLHLFPNPTQERVQLEWTLPEQSAVQFRISDALGKTIRQWTATPGQHKEEIELKGLPVGLYQVQLSTAYYQIYRQLVITAR